MPSGSETTAASAADGPTAARPNGAEGERAATRETPDATAENGDRVHTGVPSSPASPSAPSQDSEGSDGGGDVRADPADRDGKSDNGDAPAPGSPAGRGPRSGRLRRLSDLIQREAARTAAAAVAGIALALAFPPYGLWPLSLLTVAVLSLLTRRRTARQGAWTGFAFGWPFFTMLLKWLNVVGWDAVLGLAFIESLFLAALGAALAVTSRLPLWPLWGACLWVAEEWARDRVPFGGFPWGRLAFANTGSPYTPLAAMGGAPLVTFAAALTGTALAAAALALWHLRATRGGAGSAKARTASGPAHSGTRLAPA